MSSIAPRLDGDDNEEPSVISAEDVQRVRAAVNAREEIRRTGKLSVVGMDALFQLDGSGFLSDPLLKGEDPLGTLSEALILIADKKAWTILDALRQLRQNFHDAIHTCREQLGPLMRTQAQETPSAPLLHIYREPDGTSAGQ